MDMIAAVDLAWGIGRDGHMLYRLPEDLKRFKRLTTGCAVIMGRETLLSLPGSKPLPKRENIVLSRTITGDIGARVAASLPQLSFLLASLGNPPAFVIGGEAVYRLLMPYCARAYLTRVYETRPADRFFPRLTEADGWYRAEESEIRWDNGHETRYETYENTRVMCLSEETEKG